MEKIKEIKKEVGEDLFLVMCDLYDIMENDGDIREILELFVDLNVEGAKKYIEEVRAFK